MSEQILKMCSRGGSDQNLRMSEDGGASSLEESKCLAGIFQQIVNDCKVSFLISSCFVVPADCRKLQGGFVSLLVGFHQDAACLLGEQKLFYTRLR